MTGRFLRSSLAAWGHDVVLVTSADLGFKIMTSMLFDVIVADYVMAGMHGLTFLDTAAELCRGVPVILISGEDSPGAARAAMARGAFDYLVRPCSLDDLRTALQAALEYVEGMRNVIEALNPWASPSPYEPIVAASPQMQEVCRAIGQWADADVPVLLEGEPGTGKELIARTLHARSRRRRSPFLAVPCAGLGGIESLDGFFRRAGLGTVFFRTLEAMPLRLQRRLADHVRTQTFTEPGVGQMVPLECRVMASVLRPLEALLASGLLDADLGQVLGRHRIRVPPLRGRQQDIRILVGRLLLEKRPGRATGGLLDPNALAILEKYSWPGNVAELEKVVRDAVLVSGGERIRPDDLPPEVLDEVRGGGSTAGAVRDLPSLRGQVVRKYLARFSKAPPQP